MPYKLISTIIFFTSFFLLHGAVNYYIYRRGRQALSNRDKARKVYSVLFLIGYLSSSFGMFLIRYIINISSLIIPISFISHYIGSFWFGVMLYSFIIIVILDLLRLLRYLFKFNPAIINNNYQKIKEYIFLSSLFIIFIIILVGYMNASDIHITSVNLKIAKKHNDKSLNIAMISDLHINPITSVDKVEEIVEKINMLEADIVVLAGDIVDIGIEEFKYLKIGEIFKKIESKYGVFGIPGNHEYFDDIDKTLGHISKSGVTFLRDSVKKVDNSFYLIGREDFRSEMMVGKKRKSLDKLLEGVDKKLPIILLDHQPMQLYEAAENDIDLQLSGHTHNGQIIPFNFITEAIFEKSWGYLKKGNTHYYISCGIGTWGPPLRMGSVSEIVNVKLIFE